MIIGIIIDTFGQLKNDFNCRERDEKNFCFVCGIDREKLEKTSGNSGFFGHIKAKKKNISYNLTNKNIFFSKNIICGTMYFLNTIWNQGQNRISLEWKIMFWI